LQGTIPGNIGKYMYSLYVVRDREGKEEGGERERERRTGGMRDEG
jgi:hypothetical protein